MKALLISPLLVLAVTQLSCGDNLGSRQIDDRLPVNSAGLMPLCETKRLRVVYTAPETLLLGESTQLEAELFPGSPKTGHKISWWLANDAENTARGTLAEPQSCKPASSSCVRFTCTGTGSKALDAGTETPVSGLWVVAKYEDSNCYDTARVPLRCEWPPIR